ncbi:FtsX-like permease family protein [Spiroplasma endosymbiont of Othius punctulatus]|uniref:FtsX-like permease family protein n=1 Tax=Spiroplasma endosymbiont of Othius punctulatus TaxID=3066289 RepID=UPI0030CBEFE9
MWTIVIKHIKKDWKTIIGSFVTMLVSTVLVMAFVMMFASALLVKEDAEMAIAVFSSLFGMVVTIALFSLFSVTKFSIKLRNDDLKNLRILGMSTCQIGIMLLFENLIMVLLSFGFAVLLSPLITTMVVEYLIDSKMLQESFEVSNLLWIKASASGGLLLFIIMVTWMSTSEIKKISISEARNPFQEKSLVAKIICIVLGIMSIVGAILMMTLTKNVLKTEGGVGIITGAISAYIFGFCLLASTISTLVLRAFKHMTKGSFAISMSFSAMIKNITRIIVPISLMVSTMVFMSFVSNMNGIATLGFGPIEGQSPAPQYILFIVFAIYGIIIISNSLQSYLFDKKRTYRQLMVLGMKKSQIIRMNLREMVFIIVVGLLFGNGVGVLFNVAYSHALLGETIWIYNWDMFWITSSVAVVLITLNYTIPLLNIK